ncbi:hypothetical protein GY45DRAFT_435040 [Cubamyces sp. BRFM 1775]|nr:hypothetical protein GY45DRAFT_435040 [Cubamyces sp. BRFM 1775]
MISRPGTGTGTAAARRGGAIEPSMMHLYPHLHLSAPVSAPSLLRARVTVLPHPPRASGASASSTQAHTKPSCALWGLRPLLRGGASRIARALARTHISTATARLARACPVLSSGCPVPSDSGAEPACSAVVRLLSVYPGASRRPRVLFGLGPFTLSPPGYIASARRPSAPSAHCSAAIPTRREVCEHRD